MFLSFANNLLSIKKLLSTEAIVGWRQRDTLVFVDCKFIFLAAIQDKKQEKLCKKTRKPKCNLKDKTQIFCNLITFEILTL